ncbi:MAG: hypothetical protein GVY17_13380 [Cyanobacteria bacterium]|jgi:hypothetical protein|nr:hypothetical protein [Cyanobacteria bacterium GSL.Bin21]
MKKPLLIHLLIILGLSLSSCQFLPFGTETEPTNDSPNSTASSEEESPTEEIEANLEEDNQVAPVEETAAPTRSVAGLKTATDPDEFIQARGMTPGENRSDPFTLFPLAPNGEVRPQSPASESDGSPEPVPNLPAAEPAPPPPPEPKLARAVQVQGAVKIGNQVTAILKAPNEQTSRYVRVGQLIADNQVLVKRINIDQRPNPTVVLEELGIEEEVIKSVEEGMSVGEAPVEENTVGQLPPPPSSILR